EGVKDMMLSNGPQIAMGLAAAAVYCSAFHHLKDFAKRRTEKHRRVGGAVRYITDVMLPTGFFGPGHAARRGRAVRQQAPLGAWTSAVCVCHTRHVCSAVMRGMLVA
ncbi:hypothetical protein WJX81_003908, partial [Elliptochloris bilobata]